MYELLARYNKILEVAFMIYQLSDVIKTWPQFGREIELKLSYKLHRLFSENS